MPERTCPVCTHEEALQDHCMSSAMSASGDFFERSLDLLLNLRPGVPQLDSAIEHELIRAAAFVHTEIPETLELISVARLRLRQRRLRLSLHLFKGVRIQVHC